MPWFVANSISPKEPCKGTCGTARLIRLSGNSEKIGGDGLVRSSSLSGSSWLASKGGRFSPHDSCGHCQPARWSRQDNDDRHLGPLFRRTWFEDPGYRYRSPEFHQLDPGG